MRPRVWLRFRREREYRAANEYRVANEYRAANIVSRRLDRGPGSSMALKSEISARFLVSATPKLACDEQLKFENVFSIDTSADVGVNLLGNDHCLAQAILRLHGVDCMSEVRKPVRCNPLARDAIDLRRRCGPIAADPDRSTDGAVV